MSGQNVGRMARWTSRVGLIGSLLLSGTVWAAPGQLDPTFGTGGVVTNANNAARYVAVQLDGKIVVSEFGSTVARYNTDGSPDVSFGNNGVARVDVPVGLVNMSLQSDGKIVLGGQWWTRDQGFKVALVRLNGDGSLDSGFGTGGQVITSGPSDLITWGMVERPNGEILVTVEDRSVRMGRVYRYNSDGSLGTPFSSRVDALNAPALQSDGKLLAFGGGNDLAVTRYAVDGSNYESPPFIAPVPPNTDGTFNGITVQTDDKFILTATHHGTKDTSVIVRFNSDGSVDSSFANAGVLQLSLGKGGDEPQRAAVQSDGKILFPIITHSDPSSPDDVTAAALVRLNVDGTLDTTFGDGGIATFTGVTPFGTASIINVALQSDGKIVGVGTADGRTLVLRYVVGTCGDGVVETGIEECDDGNAVNGDGCDNNCTVTRCGNGIVTGTETCDDGNSVDGDGCDSNCTVTGCGNGIRTAGEACDDGNAVNGDGCESDCTITPVVQTAAAGDTVTTDPLNSGATPQFPVQTSLTTPNAGTVSIASASPSPAPTGLAVVGTELQIDAPPASTAAPLVIVLTIDASAIPPGSDASNLAVTRDGLLIDDCTGATGEASPDPCIGSRLLLTGGDVQITVLTSHASLWSVVLPGLSTTEQSCVNGGNAAGVGVAKAQFAVDVSCLTGAAKGTIADAQACLSVDPGKVAHAEAKTVTVAAKKCTPAPLFGFTSAAAINSTAQQQALALMTELFGNNLTSAVIPASDKVGSACQVQVLHQTENLLLAETQQFLKCKNAGMKGKKSPLMVSSLDLQGCFAVLQADATKAIAKAGAKLAHTVRQTCSGVTLTTAFPGACANAANLTACMHNFVGCAVCRLFNAADGLAEDCDVFDDGIANASCP